jgi:hypothetical protein
MTATSFRSRLRWTMADCAPCRGFTALPYDISEGNIGGHYPECNALIPLWHHAKGSKTPASKSIPVRVQEVAMENHSA